MTRDPIFVVHQHSARTQHYDLRLEIGRVVVWDRGTYRNRTRRDGKEVPADRALRNGHLVLELRGEKLRGGFALTRTGTDARGRERWLLVKKRDDEASASSRPVLSRPVLSRPESVLSGRTIEQLAAEAGWSSTRR